METDEVKKAGNGGMSLQTLENLLSDIRFQPPWREEADVCDDFYDSHQLTTDRLDRMNKLGIPPLITNLIAPVINSVLGMEAKSRTDWRVTNDNEANEVPEELMLALNAKLNKSERESRADRAISDAYASMIKSGVGWVEVSRSSDAFGYPYRVVDVHRNEIWWDWRAKQPDLSDARYLVRKRRFDKDELIALMPEKAELIKWAVADRFKSWQFETIQQLNNTDLANAANIERVTDIDEADWRDADRERATLFEVWYRQWKRGLVLKMPNGIVVEFNKNDPTQLMIVRNGLARPENRVFSEIRVAFFLGCHRLYDFPTPYKHRFFPYVPFFGYKESLSGVRYGMIRNMISPQNVVNSADAKMHWMLNARRLTADSDAIDTRYNSWRQVQEQLSSPNAVVFLDPAKTKARFKVESEFQLSDQQFKRRMQAKDEIEGTAGVYKAMLGKEGSAKSGIGINSLIEQSTVMMSEINDNASFARRQVGEMLFSLNIEDLMGQQVPVAIKQHGKKSIVVINRMDESGQKIVENDISQVQAKVTLEDIPTTASFKAQQLQILSDVARSLPPQMQALFVPAMVMLTDVPDKNELADALRKLSGMGKKLTDEEQEAKDNADEQAQAMAQMLQQRTAEAQTKLLEQKVEQLEQQNRKIDAERLVKMVEALYSAMQTGQIVATVPNAAPVADEILKSAGYQEAGSIPEISDNGQGQEVQPPANNDQQDDDGSGIIPPQVPDVMPRGPESPRIGEEQGIETMRNDGVRDNQA